MVRSYGSGKTLLPFGAAPDKVVEVKRRQIACAVALAAGLCAGVALVLSSGPDAKTSLMAMMTMVPVRVISFPRQFHMKAALAARHPSDALEFEQFQGGFPPRPPPSWNPSDSLDPNYDSECELSLLFLKIIRYDTNHF